MVVSEQSWILGFLSGVGYAERGKDPLHGTDVEGVSAWMDNYCQVHPLNDVADAGAAFVAAHPR